VSEYQYYDFRAVDRPLTKVQMAELRSISTRAEIGSTSFTNHYEWGDLKAEPLKLLEKYFDAFVYVTNWGEHDLYFRLPQNLVNAKDLKSSYPGRNTCIRKSGNCVVIAFESQIDGEEDWDDGTAWMGSLILLRSDLLRGDYRCLYLNWLYSIQEGTVREDTLEPPVPDGLGELSASLESLIEFMRIDEDLVRAAAAASSPSSAGPSEAELADWIQGLSERDKNDLLLAAATDSGDHWRNELLRLFQEQWTSARHSTGQRRTVGELLAAARLFSQERERLWEEEQAAKAARKKAKEEADRVVYLDQLAKREDAAWDEVTTYIKTTQPSGYERAVLLLIDLHDLAVRQEDETGFHFKLETLRNTHAKKEVFLRRLTEAKLWPEATTKLR